MTWTEILNNNTNIRSIIENRFKDFYKCSIDENDNRIYFQLPDNTSMRVDYFEKGNSLVMSYWNDHDIDMCCDGDPHYFDDYVSLDELFTAMLKETRS